jgi:hypothetical protein
VQQHQPYQLVAFLLVKPISGPSNSSSSSGSYWLVVMPEAWMTRRNRLPGWA